MKLERSAGVVLYLDPSRPGAPAAHTPDARRFLLLDYGSHWDYPKGHVEPGEDDPTAARRELQEETGITDCEFVDGFTREMTYMFRGRRGGLIKKTVVFFLGHTRESSVTLSHEHVGFAWVTPDEALKKLTYPNAKAMLNAALDHLKQTH
ncbi:MAG: bis(5'-nucleosyl)-tetraphosphatase [Tepidisphaeraceae bacterium]